MHSIQILKLYLVPNASNSTSIKSTRELYKASLDRNANDRDALVSCLRGCLTYQNNNTGRPSAAKKIFPYIYIYMYILLPHHYQCCQHIYKIILIINFRECAYVFQFRDEQVCINLEGQSRKFFGN